MSVRSTASRAVAGAGPSGWVREAHRLTRGLLRNAPGTTTYLFVLLVTSATLAGATGHAVHHLTASASTNLHNMTTHPMDVLFVSAFWVTSAWVFWPMAALMVTVMAPIERRFGTVRTLAAFAAGHVGATALTVVGIGVGVAEGWLPHALAYAVDVGPSYGLAALAGLLVMQIRRRPYRQMAIAAVIISLCLALALGGDFTDVGHLAACMVGVGAAVVLGGPGRRPRGVLPDPTSSRLSMSDALAQEQTATPTPPARRRDQVPV